MRFVPPSRSTSTPCSQSNLLLSFLALSLFLHVAGTPSTEYVSHESNLPALSNLHLALEAQRLRAHRYQLNRLRREGSIEPGQSEDEEWEDEGLEDNPRVMVLGPEGSGKTSVCKTLVNWSVRAGKNWSPVFVNLDPSEVGPFSFLFLLDMKLQEN